MKPLFRVGLTGGVGSGKSTIAEIFGRHGAGIVDADRVAHRLTAAGGGAIDPLRREFGLDAIAADGALDRGAMRRRSFADPAVRRRLEAILHPLIRDEMAVEEAQLAAADAPYSIFVIPLLVESGHARARVHQVLIVDCSVEVQLRRIRNRPGIDDLLARQILAAQASRSERLACADDVVFNEAPLQIIERAVSRLHSCYMHHAVRGAFKR